MAFDIVTEPIDRWPHENTEPRQWPRFKASYADTLELLNRELEALNARGRVVIQVVTRNGAAALRRDGVLRAQAKIEHPGVLVSFESKHGPLTYATDTFEQVWSGTMPGWQANLRAIALGLEALRKVDRYGISKSGEQYRGWRAIENTNSDRDAALDLLRAFAPGMALAGLDRLYRAARAAAHPDRQGGDRVAWDAVEAAGRVLGVQS